MKRALQRVLTFFLSADFELVSELKRDGVVTEKFVLATQQPVIAVPVNSTLKVESLLDLLNRNVRFGIASEQAAIGKITRQIASRDGVIELLENQKAVDTENVMVLAQALLAGSLDAAVLWDTTVAQINSQSDANPIKIVAMADSHESYQGDIAVGIVSKSELMDSCLALCHYLQRSESGQKAFEKFGFSLMDQGKSNRQLDHHMLAPETSR